MKRIRKYWLLVFVVLGFMLRLLFIIGPVNIFRVSIFYDDARGISYWIFPCISLVLAIYVFLKYSILKLNNLFGKLVVILVFFPILVLVFLFAMINYENVVTLAFFEKETHHGVMKVVEKSVGFNHGETYLIEFTVVPEGFEFGRVATLYFSGGERDDLYYEYSVGDVIPITFYSKGAVFYYLNRNDLLKDTTDR